jgi:type IV pilus assembly protein PilN
MKISINLATHPFVELRPLFARLKLAMGALVVVAIALGFWLHQVNLRANAEQAQIDALQSQTDALQTERKNNEARMRQTQNQAVLERSHFLNDLFASKSFSWTSVMMDLERVLPPGVQVTSIEPVIAPDHEVSIHLRVTGDRDRVVEFMRNLERSQRFRAPRPANETAQAQDRSGVVPVAQNGGAGVEFEILSGYNPLPAVDKTALEKDKAGKQGSAQTGATAGHKAAVGAGAGTSGAAAPGERGVQ